MDWNTAVPISQGGMGRVLKVFDSARQTDIAIKMLLHEDPAWAKRMMREAAAQSRLAHPNICPVYDYGERDGQHFIAMRYVDGVRLDEACRGLSLEAKISLIIDVVDAVNAAHQAGLIHRDLKPANILVETTPENGLHPFVLDFGLVRHTSDQTLTATGELLGTPGYMSPEQARADGSLDRRSDIFSLGVILYELVAGRLPFRGSTPTQMVLDIAVGDATPVQKVRPDLPRPIAQIITQCLEASPALRYQDAGSLKADLQAFLSGEPVAARRIGLVHRFNRQYKRNPVATSVVLLAAVIALAAVAMGIRSEITAGQRASLAAHYGALSEQLESDLRLAWLKPLHDLTAEVSAVSEVADELVTSLPGIPTTAADLARLAAGKALLLSDRLEESVAVLEPLVDSEYQAEAGMLLGMASGRQYGQAVVEAMQIANAEIRTRRLAALRAKLLVPARKYLRINGDDAVAAGLSAYFTGDFDRAIELLEPQLESQSWPVDLQLMLADIHLAAATVASARADYAAASDRLEQAGELLLVAANIARSHPQVVAGLCRLASTHLFVERDHADAARSPRLDQYIALCEQGIKLLPDRSKPYVDAARALANRGGRAQRNGQHAEQDLNRAEALARQSIQLDREQLAGQLVLAQALSIQGSAAADSGKAALPFWEEALASARTVAEFQPGNADVLMTLGGLAARIAGILVNQNNDFDIAQRRYLEAAAAIRAVADLPDPPAAAPSSLGFVLADHAYHRYQRGLEADGLLDEALELATAAAAAQPNYSGAQSRLGYVAWTYAEYRFLQGDDASSLLSTADRAYSKARELSPSRTSFMINHQGPLAISAMQKLNQGLPALTLIDRLDHLQRELKSRTNDEIKMPVNDALNAVLRGRQLALNKQDGAGDQFRLARQFLEASNEYEIDRVANLLTYARLALAEFDWRPQPDWHQLDQDLSNLADGLRSFPTLALVRAFRGRLALNAAALSDDQNRAGALFEEGVQELTRAVEDNPLLATRFQPDLSRANQDGSVIKKP